MFVESIEGNNVHISHSAYSTRSYWNGYACRVNTYTKTELTAGGSVDMYRGGDSAHYVTVLGFLHLGLSPGPGPEPPEPEPDNLIILFKKGKRFTIKNG